MPSSSHACFIKAMNRAVQRLAALRRPQCCVVAFRWIIETQNKRSLVERTSTAKSGRSPPEIDSFAMPANVCNASNCAAFWLGRRKPSSSAKKSRLLWMSKKKRSMKTHSGRIKLHSLGQRRQREDASPDDKGQ